MGEGAGDALRNVGGSLMGAAQIGLGLRQRKKADALLPTPEDRLSRGYLNMIQGRRRALQTGTANNTDRAAVRQLMKSMGNAGFQAGGQVNTGVLSQILSQQADNMRAANAAEIGQLTQQEGAQVGEMAQRKSDLGMYRSQTMAARAEGNVKAGGENLMAAVMGGQGTDKDGNKTGKKSGGLVDMKGKGKGGDGGKLSTALKAAKLAAVASDINLKENISHVGVENGFNIYEYNYKNDPSSRYRGVMAQEVALSRPDAVAYKNGYLGVYYDKIGLTMEKIK
jgi:hypothetical protein